MTAPTLGRAQSIDRSIAVRAADNFAVMQDLPNGEQRTGQAFPIVAYFDPFPASVSATLPISSESISLYSAANRGSFRYPSPIPA